MDKTELLTRIRSSREEWEATLSQLDESQITQAMTCGEWSIKDTIAHIVWHEREMVGVLQARALIGSDLWNLPLEQRNAAIFMENKDRTLEDVLEEAQRVFEQLIQQVEGLAEEDLHDPGRFAEMPPDWKLWELLAENTYAHYPDHTAQVQAWLGSEATNQQPGEGTP